MLLVWLLANLLRERERERERSFKDRHRKISCVNASNNVLKLGEGKGQPGQSRGTVLLTNKVS